MSSLLQLIKRHKKEQLVDDVIRDLNRHGRVVLDGVPEARLLTP